jgi:ubiquinol-cytochrome c reductase cytochrome b subunit
MRILRRMWQWLDDRTGIVALVKPLAVHPVPPNTGWSYIFGSATLTAFLLQVVTGIALATVYVPSSGSAYESLQFINNQAAFGRLLRGVHYFGASAMILLAGIHMIRVFLTGSFKFPREMNWISGVFLLFLTVALGFTGQMLRWDQNAVWTAVVGAEQAGRVPLIGTTLGHFFLGGNHPGSATLSRFFTLHVFVFPALLLLIVGFHLTMVIRNGISEPPRPDRPVDLGTYRDHYHAMLDREGVPFWPDAAWRDAVFGFVVIVGIFVAATFFGAPPLDKPPSPSIIKALPRPDWYLMWYYAVLALLPHKAEAYVIVFGPLLAVLFLLALPLWANRGHRHPGKRPWAVGSVLLIVVSIGALWYAGIHANWSPRFDAEPLTDQIIGTTSGPVYQGGKLFSKRGCLFCHTISGHGGKRGPDLTTVGDRLTENQMIIRILNGGYNMPHYGGILGSGEVKSLVAFLQSRKRD